MRDYLKNKFLIPFILLFGFCPIIGFPQFAPAAGDPGTTAIHMDSSIFVNWATNCSIIIGQEDISNPQSVLASAGDSTMAIGAPGNGVVSLGDGGYAVLTFEKPIKNGTGWDFAIFENSFSNTFLELGLVEVSSDGLNYFQFESTSFTQDTLQIDAFGTINPEMINNLAGKYRATFGTPFDLEELAFEQGLDVNNITHIKIIDVIGSIDPAIGTYDQFGNIINDPFPTPFPSSGFDLDAIGVIHEQPLNLVDNHHLNNIYNLIIVNGIITYNLKSMKEEELNCSIIDLSGKKIYENEIIVKKGINSFRINISDNNKGIYLLKISSYNGSFSKKFFITK